MKLLALLLAAALPTAALAQTVTVTIGEDQVDIDWQTATIADLPGPDGEVSFSEAIIATNNTPGHQTIAFQIPQSKWLMQWLYPGRAVLVGSGSSNWRAFDEVTIDGTTQTLFTGDTYADGAEVAVYGAEIYLNEPNSAILGFDHASLNLSDVNGLMQGNTASNLSLWSAHGSLVTGNEGGTIKIDSSNDVIVTANTMQRVRIWSSANCRVGGPSDADRNFLVGYGYVNSEGLPSGTILELYSNTGTLIENNYVGTTPDGMDQGNLSCTVGVWFTGDNVGVTLRNNLISGILGHGQGPHYAGTLWGWSAIFAGTTNDITFVDNRIGLDATGAPTLGSVWGLDIGNAYYQTTQSTNTRIEGNVIAGHILNGVTVGRNTTEVRLQANEIYDNGWLGIDLIPTGLGYGVTANDSGDGDVGGNGLQNFPVLTYAALEGGVVHALGTLNSAPSRAYVVELFASEEQDPTGHGEGQLYLGSTTVTTDGSGNAAFDVTLPTGAPLGWFVSATATDDAVGATSEFALCMALTDGGSNDLGTNYCGPAVPNSTGQPGVIRASGSDVVSDANFHLHAEQLPLNKFGYFLVSATQGFVSNPGGSQGNLCLAGTIGRFQQQLQNSGTTGTFTIQVDLSHLPGPLNVPVLPGQTWNFQCWYRDKNPTTTSNFTDAVSVLFQ